MKLILILFLINLVCCKVKKCSFCEGIHCKCHRNLITCSDWSNMDEIEEHITSSDNSACDEYGTFNLTTSHLPALPEHIFKNTRFNTIEFSGVSLPFLGPPLSKESPFSGLERSFGEFKMENVLYLYNWDWALLSNFSYLTRLTVTKSKVLRINKSFSSISNSLTKIELRECQIKRIDDGSFKSFNRLEQLYLNKNQLTSFKRSHLPDPAGHLTLIDIRNH
ncbi:uncharacterized protein LOC111629972 isoform X2 [Centruroides sculpturatus]|uniref:uncharacterized protein LOC111629972 isoform X2 n=1 Tax=Centruroides sculpturatus TaxID=218467 RepID=UPI000C6D4CC3|nr:uncharacterized protein LOC111629972 isoform X2 [Centruroides sculpturatus]